MGKLLLPLISGLLATQTITNYLKLSQTMQVTKHTSFKYQSQEAVTIRVHHLIKYPKKAAGSFDHSLRPNISSQ